MGILSEFFIFLFITMSCLAAEEIKIGSVVVSSDNLLEERSQKEVLTMPNYRDEMRKNVIAISNYAKERNKNFSIITRQGDMLLTVGEWEEHLDEVKIAASRGVFDKDEIFIEKMFNSQNLQGKAVGSPESVYSSAIDGMVIDYHKCNGHVLSDNAIKEIRKKGTVELHIRHCDDTGAFYKALVNDKFPNNASFAIKDGFNTIPSGNPPFYNSNNISGLKSVKNFLLLTDYSRFDNKDVLITKLADTNYDLLVINPFFNKKNPFSLNEIKSLKYKKLGAKRLVFAAIDISRFGLNDFYFKETYKYRSPEWIKYIDKGNPDRYVVEYFHPEYRKILGKFIKGIVDLNYDGVLLDGVDAHLVFEKTSDID